MKKPKLISIEKAFDILVNHNLTPRQNYKFKNGKKINKNSFIEEFGIKETYDRKEVLKWLGY